MLTEDDIKNALKAVKYPGYSRDIVSFGLVKQIAARDGAISVSMQLTTSNPDIANRLKSDPRLATLIRLQCNILYTIRRTSVVLVTTAL